MVILFCLLTSFVNRLYIHFIQGKWVLPYFQEKTVFRNMKSGIMKIVCREKMYCTFPNTHFPATLFCIPAWEKQCTIINYHASILSIIFLYMLIFPVL